MAFFVNVNSSPGHTTTILDNQMRKIVHLLLAVALAGVVTVLHDTVDTSLPGFGNLAGAFAFWDDAWVDSEAR